MCVWCPAGTSRRCGRHQTFIINGQGVYLYTSPLSSLFPCSFPVSQDFTFPLSLCPLLIFYSLILACSYSYLRLSLSPIQCPFLWPYVLTFPLPLPLPFPNPPTHLPFPVIPTPSPSACSNPPPALPPAMAPRGGGRHTLLILGCHSPPVLRMFTYSFFAVLHLMLLFTSLAFVLTYCASCVRDLFECY